METPLCPPLNPFPLRLFSFFRKRQHHGDLYFLLFTTVQNTPSFSAPVDLLFRITPGPLPRRVCPSRAKGHQNKPKKTSRLSHWYFPAPAPKHVQVHYSLVPSSDVGILPMPWRYVFGPSDPPPAARARPPCADRLSARRCRKEPKRR